MIRAKHISTAGFTLIELMMVVIVIGVMVSLTAPNIRSGFNDMKARGEIERLPATINTARARAIGTGRAQLLRFTGTNNGQLEHFEGNTNSCIGSAWGEIATVCDGANPRCRSVVAPDNASPSEESWPLEVARDVDDYDQSTLEFCFDSFGVTHWRPAGAGAWTDSPGAAGAIRFGMVRQRGATNMPRRIVVVPAAGAARMLR